MPPPGWPLPTPLLLAPEALAAPAFAIVSASELLLQAASTRQPSKDQALLGVAMAGYGDLELSSFMRRVS